jgi:thioredoxin reductase
VEGIETVAGGLLVRTNHAVYETRAVLLAIGRRGTPRKLGVPGEESSRVVYRLVDPDQYRGKHILVVGGGDSALEAAADLADGDVGDVTLAYRGDAFSRAKPANRNRIEAAEYAGRLRILLRTEVSEILPATVRLVVNGRDEEIANDAVIVCAGGVLPRAFLEDTGIHVETKHGTA